MNKMVFLVLSMLEISKSVIYEFQYNCIKLRYREKAKLYIYTDTDSFRVFIKPEDNSVNIAKDVKTKF